MMFYDVLWCSMIFYVLRAFLVSFCRSVPPEFLHSFLFFQRLSNLPRFFLSFQPSILLYFTTFYKSVWKQEKQQNTLNTESALVSINRRKRFLPFIDTFWSFSCFQTPFLLSSFQHFLLFIESKCLDIFAVSPVSRHFLEPKVSINGSKHFLPLPDTFCPSPVSGHFFLLYLEPKVSRNGRKRIFLIPDIFCRFSCFQTLFSVISKTKSV